MQKFYVCLAVLLLFGCTGASKKTFQNKSSHQRQPIINYDMSLDAQLDSLARQVGVQLDGRDCRRIGLKGFYDLKGRSRRFEKYVEIEFTNRLIRTGQFQVYAPEELETLNEHVLLESAQDAARLNPQTRSVVRSIVIDSFMIGSTVELPQGVKVSIKLISSRTGSVFGTASVMVHKNRTVESLLESYGAKTITSGVNTRYRVGDVIKAGENQYIDLIPSGYVLYVKQINFEYDLLTDSHSTVEIFLNEEYRVMKVDDMISLTFETDRYILSLRDVADRMAIFTFAHLGEGRFKTTETFSQSEQEPYDEETSGERPAIAAPDSAGDGAQTRSTATEASISTQTQAKESAATDDASSPKTAPAGDGDESKESQPAAWRKP